MDFVAKNMLGSGVSDVSKKFTSFLEDGPEDGGGKKGKKGNDFFSAIGLGDEEEEEEEEDPRKSRRRSSNNSRRRGEEEEEEEEEDGRKKKKGLLSHLPGHKSRKEQRDEKRASHLKKADDMKKKYRIGEENNQTPNSGDEHMGRRTKVAYEQTQANCCTQCPIS
jgi:hypothetical protein